MSRSISIWHTKNEKDINIDVGNRDLFGTQMSSKQFWSLEILYDLGIVELSKLGRIDPIYFSGHLQLSVLEKEIRILENHKAEIDYHRDLVDRWLENLRFCLYTLLETTPKDSIPNLMIG